MTRSLRPRRNVRPRYATTDGDDVPLHGEEGSRVPPVQSNASLAETDDSGSDFVPEVIDTSHGQENGDESFRSEQNHVQLEIPALATSSSMPTTGHVKGSAKAKGKRKATQGGTESPSKPPSVVQLAPGLSRPSHRQMYSLPTPSLHHRHRAVPLFPRPGQVERLESPPPLFGPTSTVPTNSFTHDQRVTERANKAWGYNVGSGPLWDLTEDRGWYKEALPDENEVGREINRRPRIYAGLRVVDGWAILSARCVRIHV